MHVKSLSQKGARKEEGEGNDEGNGEREGEGEEELPNELITRPQAAIVRGRP